MQALNPIAQVCESPPLTPTEKEPSDLGSNTAHAMLVSDEEDSGRPENLRASRVLFKT